MDQDLYREAETMAIDADRAAFKAIGYIWENIERVVKAYDRECCHECGGDLTEETEVCFDPDCYEFGKEEHEQDLGSPLTMLDPLSIEEDGRMILGFGGPNIWTTSDLKVHAAWWGSTITCTAETSDQYDALERIYEEARELDLFRTPEYA